MKAGTIKARHDAAFYQRRAGKRRAFKQRMVDKCATKLAELIDNEAYCQASEARPHRQGWVDKLSEEIERDLIAAADRINRRFAG